MTSILNQVAEAQSHFEPAMPKEYLALQIARKLNDLEHLRHYLVLLEHYPEELIVRCFHLAINSNGNHADSFHQALQSITNPENDESNSVVN